MPPTREPHRFSPGARQAFELTLSNIGEVALLTAGERLLLTLAKVFLSPTAPVSPICRTPLFPYLTFYSFSALGRVLLHCRRRTLDEARARAL